MMFAVPGSTAPGATELIAGSCAKAVIEKTQASQRFNDQTVCWRNTRGVSRERLGVGMLSHKLEIFGFLREHSCREVQRYEDYLARKPRCAIHVCQFPHDVITPSNLDSELTNLYGRLNQHKYFFARLVKK